MRVQTLAATSQVTAGHTATFVVWVWSDKAESRGVTVATRVASARYVGSPRFTICLVTGTAICKLGNLPTGQADELRVTVPVGRKASVGEQVTLTAKATAKGAKSWSGSATDQVAAAPSPSPTPTSTPISLPPVGIPPVTGTGTTPQIPTGLFPTIGPTPSSTPSLGLPVVSPHKSAVRAADASARVPMDPRLIGGQLAGLAVLAGGVAMAIARLSIRKPKPAGSSEGQRPNTGNDAS